MILRAVNPSEMGAKGKKEFIAFVVAAGEVSAGTLPGLVDQAFSLVTLHDGQALVGTAAIKVPSDAHRCGDFRKADVEEQADAYPFELGWVVVHSDYRGQGHARSLLAKAIESVQEHGLYATTKTDQMRKMFPEYGFSAQGVPYPSALNPDVELTLFARPPHRRHHVDTQ